MCHFMLFIVLLMCWPVGAEASDPESKVCTAIKPRVQVRQFSCGLGAFQPIEKTLFESIRDWHNDLVDAILLRPRPKIIVLAGSDLGS